MAGEVSLLKRQLAPRILPDDFWDWYLVKAGRSAISGSFTTYVSNFVKAFGDRLTYMRDVGLTGSQWCSSHPCWTGELRGQEGVASGSHRVCAACRCCKETAWIGVAASELHQAICAGLIEMHRGEGLLFHCPRSYAMQKGTPP
jgi:hypothetical protein